MRGTYLVIGLVGFAAIFGAGLWYAQVYAYYHEVEDLPAITVAGEDWPVSAYHGIEASSSPLKLRACFRLEREWSDSDQWRDQATPLTAPHWFDCFDAEAIARDIAAGRAVVYQASAGEFDGTERYVAHYPDGRAFMWRQLSAEFAK